MWQSYKLCRWGTYIDFIFYKSILILIFLWLLPWFWSKSQAFLGHQRPMTQCIISHWPYWWCQGTFLVFSYILRSKYCWVPSLSLHRVSMCDAAKLGKVEATADKFPRSKCVLCSVWWFWDRQLEANRLQKLRGLNLELDYLLLIRHNCLTHINCWVALNATTMITFIYNCFSPADSPPTLTYWCRSHVNGSYHD